jgi:hypothetical protein
MDDDWRDLGWISSEEDGLVTQLVCLAHQRQQTSRVPESTSQFRDKRIDFMEVD